MGDLVGKRKETREEGRRRAREEAELQRRAAEDIEQLFDELVADLRQSYRTRDGEAASEADDRARSTDVKIRHQSLYLPPDLMDRVRVVLEVAMMADELEPSRYHQGYHYHANTQILRHCLTKVREQLSAFLRGKPLTRMSSILDEYQFALQRDYDDRAIEYAEEVWQAEHS